MDFKNFDFEKMKKDEQERKLNMFFDTMKKKNPKTYEKVADMMKNSEYYKEPEKETAQEEKKTEQPKKEVAGEFTISIHTGEKDEYQKVVKAETEKKALEIWSKEVGLYLENGYSIHQQGDQWFYMSYPINISKIVKG